MASFNKIVIVGYLGRDVETRYLPDGTAVSNFSVATTEKSKRGGESQEITTWFRANCYGKLAELCAEWLHKGSQVYVEGRLSQEEYTDRDGNKRSTLTVKATEVQFLGSKGDGQQPQVRTRPQDELDGATQYAQRKAASRQASLDDDDSLVPF